MDNPVITVHYFEPWGAYVAVHSQYQGIIGSAGEIHAAVNELLSKINDSEGREIYPIYGGWRSPD